MPSRPEPRLSLRPGPFFRAAASRLDLQSRRGFPVTIAGACATLAFLSFLLIVEDVMEPVTLWMDSAAHAAVLLTRTPALSTFFWLVTLVGDWRVMLVETLVAAVLLAVWGHPRRAGSIVVLVLTGQLVATVLKNVVDRPRPPAAFALIAQPVGASFPSGHAMAGVLLFGTLALMVAATKFKPRVRVGGSVLATTMVVLIGLSRVYLGVHYFSDVLASWLLGVTMLSVWAAAVLVWGRSQPPIEDRPAHAWGSLAWRRALVAAGLGAIVLVLVFEMSAAPLL